MLETRTLMAGTERARTSRARGRCSATLSWPGPMHWSAIPTRTWAITLEENRPTGPRSPSLATRRRPPVTALARAPAAVDPHVTGVYPPQQYAQRAVDVDQALAARLPHPVHVVAAQGHELGQDAALHVVLRRGAEHARQGLDGGAAHAKVGIVRQRQYRGAQVPAW